MRWSNDKFFIIMTSALRPNIIFVILFYPQILLVNITAINAFTLVYRRRALEFGVGDRRLLLYVYGVPCVLAVCLAAAGQLGPSGAL